jgi:hypothetical protein
LGLFEKSGTLTQRREGAKLFGKNRKLKAYLFYNTHTILPTLSKNNKMAHLVGHIAVKDKIH